MSVLLCFDLICAVRQKCIVSVFTAKCFHRRNFASHHCWHSLIPLSASHLRMLPAPCSSSSNSPERTLARSSAERLKSRRWEGQLSQDLFHLLAVEAKALTETQVWGRGDACLYWYARRLYMNQKMTYLMAGSAHSEVTPISLGVGGQVWAICAGNGVRRFILSARKRNIFICLLTWLVQIHRRLRLGLMLLY